MHWNYDPACFAIKKSASRLLKKKYIPAKTRDYAFLKQHCLVCNKIFSLYLGVHYQKNKKFLPFTGLHNVFFPQDISIHLSTLGLFFRLNQLLPVHSNAITSEPWKFDLRRHKHVPGDRLSLSVAKYVPTI